MTQLKLDSRLPWAALAFLVVSASAETALFALRGMVVPRETQALWTLLFSLAWSWWIYVDRRLRRIGYPFEFDALVFFAWPFVAPYYLVRSRATRPRLATAFVWLLYALPFVVSATCYVLVTLWPEP